MSPEHTRRETRGSDPPALGCSATREQAGAGGEFARKRTGGSRVFVKMSVTTGVGAVGSFDEGFFSFLLFRGGLGLVGMCSSWEAGFEGRG